MAETSLRVLKPGEQETLLRILDNAYGLFHNETEVRAVLSSNRFDPNSCFIAEEHGSPVGSVAITKLPRENWFAIRYLAVGPIKNRTEVGESLLTRALDLLRSIGSEYIRATTPSIQPYVNIYKRHGFIPLRRDFRICWEVSRKSPREEKLSMIEEVSKDRSRQAADLFVQSLHPYWDWRTKEQGGPALVAESFVEGLNRGERWFFCGTDNEVVGLTGMIVDYYNQGEARFRGAYVLPEHRGRGLGLAVMNQALKMLKKLDQHRMTIYTFSNLDCLAPGALLYLRSGGKIEAEYTLLGIP